MTDKIRHHLCLALISISLIAASNMSSALALSTNEIANLSGADRQRILEQGAKKEGTVMWYTSLIVNQAVRPIRDAFEKKYPFLKLQYVRSSSSKLVQKLLAENRARSFHADIVVASVAPVLKKVRLAQPFLSPYLAAYPKSSIDPERMWATIRYSYNGIGYNTKMVTAAEAPKTYEDLLDPKWKGRMVWAKSTETGAPLFIAILTKAWGEKKAMAYFRKLARQKIVTGTGSVRSVLDRVIAGEYAVMISAALHHVAISAAKGAPVASTSPEPVLGRNGYLMILKSAPHPHASMLFTDFLLSREGQTILRKAKYLPAHPGVEPLPEMKSIVPKYSGRKVYVMDPDEHASARKPSVGIFRKLFK